MEINSSTYWEGRFSTDWKANAGPEQSRMFAEVAVAMLPQWLKDDAAENQMRLIDVGCAEGDALPVLDAYFGSAVRLKGTDFSETAIASAREKYPAYEFEVGDATAMGGGGVDIAFCSNVLEHFHEPLPILAALAEAAAHYVIIVVPFWEFTRDVEHFVTFDTASFPLVVGDLSLAYWNVADLSRLPDTRWLGYQAVLVYATGAAVQRAGLKMRDLVRNAYFPGLTANELLSAAKNDAGLHRALQLGVSQVIAADGSPHESRAMELRVNEVAARQEAIGFAVHEQLNELTAKVAELSSARAENAEPAGSALALERRLNEVASRQQVIADALVHQLSGFDLRMEELGRDQEAHSQHLQVCLTSLDSAASDLHSLGEQLTRLASIMDVIVTRQKLLDETLEQHHQLIGRRVDSALEVISERFSTFNVTVNDVMAELRGSIPGDSSSLRVWSLKDMVFSMEDKLAQQGVAINDSAAALKSISKFGMEVEIMEKEKKGMAGSIGALEKQVSELEARYAASEAARRVAESNLRAMQDSRSWRITAPLRKLMTRFRGKRAVTSASGAALGIAVQKTPGVDHRAEFERILMKHSGRKIIVFRPLVDWDLPLFQRPHHIAARLARQGFLYFYCTPNAYDGMDGFKEVEDGLYLTNQFDLVSGLYAEKIVHLYSTDNHCSLDYVRGQQAAHAQIIYEYIDEIDPTISGVEIPQHVWDKHNALIADESVICIASADKLYGEVLEKRSNNVALVTNGVEYEHFTKSLHTPPPMDIADWVQAGKPIVGYFGALATWFDYELVEKCAARYPELNFLLLGWDYDGTLGKSDFSKYSNIRVVGPIPYKLLPDYARFFDVSTIPFKINAVTESTSPIKLFEYMSMGKPIVTTDMPECRKYKSVMIGKTHESYVDLIGKAMERRSDVVYKALLREEALANTWDAKAKVISDLLA